MTFQSPKSAPRFSRRALLRTAAYSGLALAGAAGFAASDEIEVIRQRVVLPQLPSAHEGTTIGVMADFHAGAWGNREPIERGLKLMRQERPDLIVLLGDFVDGAHSRSGDNVARGAWLFGRFKEELAAPLGVYAVLGNHDHWAGAQQVMHLLQAVEIDLLGNANRQLPGGLVLAGVDDYWEGPGQPERAMGEIKKGQPTILLSHNPDINLALGPESPASLVLSGHTHGGQIRTPFTGWAPWVPCSPHYRGASGLLRETPQRQSFISKGVGTFLLPLRLNCPPDIAVLRLIRG